MRAIQHYLLLGIIASGCAGPAAQRPADEPRPLTLSPAAQRQQALRSQIDALLAASAPAQEWRGLDAEAVGVLQQIINDPASAPKTRVAAVGALAFLGDLGGSKALAGICADVNQLAELRVAAVLALATLGESSLSVIRTLLSNASPTIRTAAATALARIGGSEARTALEARVEKEEDPSVRDALQRALTTLQP
jgi:HEAT repeat protein